MFFVFPIADYSSVFYNWIFLWNFNNIYQFWNQISEDGYEIERHKGSVTPNYVYTSRTNSVTLKFRSDPSGSYEGFLLSYNRKLMIRHKSIGVLQNFDLKLKRAREVIDWKLIIFQFLLYTIKLKNPAIYLFNSNIYFIIMSIVALRCIAMYSQWH